MRKRILKKSEVLREGFNKGLRDALRILDEASEYYFSGDGQTTSASSDGGDYAPEVVPNKRERKFTPSQLKNQLNKDRGKGAEKYPGVSWNPEKEHVVLGWDKSKPSRGKRSHTVNVSDFGRVGRTPSQKDIDIAINEYHNDDPRQGKTRKAKVKYWANVLFRNGNARSEQAFIRSSHVIADSIGDLDKYPNGPETVEMLSILYKPLDKAKVLETGMVEVWDVQKAAPRKINLGTLVYMDFVEYDVDDRFTDRNGNTFEVVPGTYYWEKLSKTVEDDEFGDDEFTVYAYGDKDKEGREKDPDRVNPGTKRKFNPDFTTGYKRRR